MEALARVSLCGEEKFIAERAEWALKELCLDL